MNVVEDEYCNKTCKIMKYCLRDGRNGIFTLNIKGYIYDAERMTIESFDAKIIKNNLNEFNNYINAQNKEDRVLLVAEGHWWQIHIELNSSDAFERNERTDILIGSEFTQNEIDGNCFDPIDVEIPDIVCKDFKDTNYHKLGIPLLIWSVMIGMLTT